MPGEGDIMKHLRLLCLLGIIICCACNASTNSDANGTVRDTTGLIPDSTAVYDTLVQVSPRDTVLFGFYQGMLPCQDCQGIRHTLMIKDSGRFKLEEFVLGKDMFPEKLEGRWTRLDDSLRLQANRQIIATYYIAKDTLKLAYRQGRPNIDSLSDNYAVIRQPSAAANHVWKKRFQSGADFYGIGNEPFWSIEVDNEKSITFRLADLPNPVTFPAAPPRVDKDSIFYSTSSGGAKLEVTIYNEFCNDGMSDNLYEHRVHVRYKGETFKGCGVKK